MAAPRPSPSRAIPLILLTTAFAAPLAAQENGQGERVFHQTFAVAAGGTLDVRVGDADVRIIPGGETGVEVSTFLRANDPAWGRERYESMGFEARQQGTTVLVTGREPRGYENRWRRRSWFSVTTEIRVPARFAVSVHTGDGDVSVGTLAGTLEVRTDDGDIGLTDVQGGPVMLHTADGDIVAGRLMVTAVTVDTEDGDIVIGSASGQVRVHTNDGDVRIALAQAGPVTIMTDDGDVDVSVSAGFAASVDLSGEDVDLAAPIQVTGRVNRGRVRGSLHGGGPELTVRTGDGSISLVERAGS